MIQYSGLAYATIFFICAIIGQTALVKVNPCLLLSGNILSITSFLVFMVNVVYYEANNTGVQVRFLKKWELYFQNYVNYVFPYLNIAQYSQGGLMGSLNYEGNNIETPENLENEEKSKEEHSEFDKSYVEKVMMINPEENKDSINNNDDNIGVPAYDSNYGEISYGSYDTTANQQFQEDPLSLLEENEMFEHTVVNYVQQKFGCCGYGNVSKKIAQFIIFFFKF